MQLSEEIHFTSKKSFYLNLSFKKAIKLQNGFPCSPFSKTFPHGNDVTEGQYRMQENCTVRIKRSNSVGSGGSQNDPPSRSLSNTLG